MYVIASSSIHCSYSIPVYLFIHHLKPDEKRESLDELFKQYLGSYGDDAILVPPFTADYGSHIFIGKNTFINMNACLLDTANIIIEDEVMLGPNVSLFTAGHPLREIERRQIPSTHLGLEYALPITIKKGAWLAGNVTVLPGVTIGERAVIGAGSVVTKDIPADSVAVGSPARVIRTIDQREILPPDALTALQAEVEDPHTSYLHRLLALHTISEQKKLSEHPP